MAEAVYNRISQQREALFDQILETLELMPNELREAFVLAHYEHLKPEEMSTRLGVQPAELEALIGDANQIFYRRLRKRC